MDIPSMTLGYDRAITIFSPEGRILQVEYARQAVRSGSTALGLAAKDGVVIIADKRLPSKMVVEDSVEKIYLVDDHIIATFSGFIPDGRVLIDKARVLAQEHRLTYGAPIDMLTLIKEISDIKQAYTQYGGLRPFGVSLIFAGIDNGVSKVFMTDPAGLYLQFKAVAIGEGEGKVTQILESGYREDMTVEEAIKFGIDAIKEFLGEEFDIHRINVAYIKIGDKKPTFMTKEEIEKLYNESS